MAEAARVGSGFEKMETYIWRRQNTVMQDIATQLLLDVCEATNMKHGGPSGDSGVGAGGHCSGRSKRDDNDGGRGGCRRDGRVKEGLKWKTPGLGQPYRIQSSVINQIGT